MSSLQESNASKNIIVSGGAQGIGRALGRYLLEAGHRIFIFDIQEDELKHTATTHLERYHKDGKVGYAVCNLRNVEEIRSNVDQAAKFFGGQIDVPMTSG
jgi:NAD(P)-dependent dehydrogenase (short-subunit alcohol dehydrogenase family)